MQIRQYGGKQVDKYLHAAGIAPHELFELHSLMAIAMMVDRGLGVSLVPDIIGLLTTGLHPAKIPLPVESEPRRFGVLWQKASSRGRLSERFLQCLPDAVLGQER